MTKKDVKLWDDLVTYLVNAILCENHCLCSYAETKDNQFLEVAQEVRKNRSKWLDSFTKENKGQLYCINKHLLACSGTLKELANRLIIKDKKLSEECLEESRIYENLFIELNK